jgi:drug/metabolite transporter (DMT)-like permease
MAANKAKYFKLLAGVTAISFSPLAVKLVSFPPSVSAFYRSFYAACFFLLAALAGRFYKGAQPGGNNRWLLPSAIAGVFLGVDLALWHRSIIYVGAGPATFLGNSQILFVTLFAALVFRERIPWKFYLVLAMTAAGLYLLMPASASGHLRLAGYTLGLLVGVTYAGMLISLRYAKNLSAGRYPELLSLAVVFTASAAVIAVSLLLLERRAILSPDLKGHALMALTALFCQTLGWYLINSTILTIPAHEGSLLLMLQPLLATVWGCLFFLEPFSPVQLAGAALSLAGIAWYQLSKPETCVQKAAEAQEVL